MIMGLQYNLLMHQSHHETKQQAEDPTESIDYFLAENNPLLENDVSLMDDPETLFSYQGEGHRHRDTIKRCDCDTGCVRRSYC